MNNAAEETNQTSSRRPTHIAYSVKERDGKKGEWRPIGVAWTHTDGKGINISLDLFPIDGRITLRAAEEKSQ
jgi:hypothetical protein